jgi:ABC-type transport system involved in cytochrome c biogenesis permease subunit
MRGFGYLISILSVLLIGAVAWPKPDEPRWKIVALLAGMVLSIAGMGLRWLASRKQKHQMETLEMARR